MIQADQNSSVDDIQSEESANLADLRKKLELTNIQLLELTYNDEKFLQSIDNFNLKGIERVNSEEFKEALIYFNQNEKILQYAASCGKTIDRSAIIATLHNQACVHQKLWDLQKSANYIEAILYNINFYLEGRNQKKAHFVSIKNKEKIESQNFTALTHKIQNYALYHLQFCAVNSQIRKHTVSIQSAHVAIKVIKQVCSLTAILLETSDSNKIFLNEKNILIQLANLDENLSTKNHQIYLKKIKILMRDKVKQTSALQEQFRYLKTFSIGKLMQLIPIKISQIEKRPSVQEWIKYDNTLIKALYLGVSYFTVGTQLRFLSSQNSEEGSEQYKNSQQFKTSEVYHLYAILIVLTYVPIDTIFLNHLVTSFNNHYMMDLEKHSTSQISINFEPSEFHNQSPIKNSQSIRNQGGESDRELANSLPQQSDIKMQIVQRGLQSIKSSSKYIKADINSRNNNQNSKQQPVTNILSNKNGKISKINNVQKVMFIKKNQKMIKQQQFQSQLLIERSKSPNRRSNSKKNKRKLINSTKDQTQQKPLRDKRPSFKERKLNTNQVKTKSKGKKLMERLLSKQNLSKRKSKNSSSNSNKVVSKKKSIYTDKNIIDQVSSQQKYHRKQSKKNKKSPSKSKSISIKSTTNMGKNANRNIESTQCKNQNSKSPSLPIEQAFVDRAKMVQSKTEDIEDQAFDLKYTIHKTNSVKNMDNGIIDFGFHKQKQKSKSKSKLVKQKIKLNKIQIIKSQNKSKK